MKRNNKPSDEGIKKILNKHKKWIETERREGERADLSGADLSGADLSRADLSGAKGLINPIDYILENFEKTEKGIVVYKALEAVYQPPNEWAVEQESIIEEIANSNRADECGCGTNVATKEWAFKNYPRKEIWKCLIKWEWLAGVRVPYNTDGKIRCSRLELLEKVEE